MAIFNVYIYTFAILVCKSNAQNIDYGNMCLESASKFWNSGATSRCGLKESEIRKFLQNANTTCPKKCKFTMSNKTSNGAIRGLKIQLLFNDRNKTELEACSNNPQNKRFGELYINCSSWNKGDYGVYENSWNCQDSNGHCDLIYTVCACHCQPGYTMVKDNCKNANEAKVNEVCESITQCTGTDNLRNCSGGVCVCQAGYVSINNTCHQGNITFSQTCISDVQCTGTPLATNCSAGRCTCQVGHVPENNTCYPVTERQGHRADGNKKSPFAAIIGGLFAGVVIVTVSAFLIYKRFCRNYTTRKEPVIHFENHHYDAKGIDDNATPLKETKQENAANKSPHDHSKEAVEYSHIYDETRDALAQDDVYHHLNEEKDQKQDDNNYDHASAAVGHVTNLSEYSLISDFKNDKTVSLTEEQDEYFIIEQSFSTNG
ncbi:uncharacterized protein [Magallana gigas]|uniref:uncharacterized protein isoform X2 n=1 Tax=Magallana gigas TaxID=29159 RepID=UPI00333F8D84